jgi:hypothetical protein
VYPESKSSIQAAPNIVWDSTGSLKGEFTIERPYWRFPSIYLERVQKRLCSDCADVLMVRRAKATFVPVAADVERNARWVTK